MCFPADAVPPIPPIAGASVAHEDLVLESRDGTKFAAFAAKSNDPSGIGVVILPDVRGLYRFYEELALRFAEEQINAVAIDYFGRTAGVAKRDDDFPFMDHIAQTEAARIADDVAAAVAYLKSPAGGECESIFTMGFCFGGSNSWLQAANGHGLAGVVGFYGRPTSPGRDGSPSPADRAGEMECPLLGLMGGADPMIPAEDVAAFDAALSAVGVDHEIITYPGAPHSFFDRSFEEHAQASADAWKRVLAFVRQHHRARV